MQEALLFQADEMIHNLIKAEHKGMVKITEVRMEDSRYGNEDNDRYLSIIIEYVPSELDGERMNSIGITTERVGNSISNKLKAMTQKPIRGE